jgi:hypothetical protein
MGLTRGNEVLLIIAAMALMLLALAAVLAVNGLVVPIDQMMTESKALAA